MKHSILSLMTCALVAYPAMFALGDDPADPAPVLDHCCTDWTFIDNPACSVTCVAPAPTCSPVPMAQWAVSDADCSTPKATICKRKRVTFTHLMGTCAVQVCPNDPTKSRCWWTPNGTSFTDSYLKCTAGMCN